MSEYLLCGFLTSVSIQFITLHFTTSTCIMHVVAALLGDKGRPDTLSWWARWLWSHFSTTLEPMWISPFKDAAFGTWERKALSDNSSFLAVLKCQWLLSYCFIINGKETMEKYSEHRTSLTSGKEVTQTYAQKILTKGFTAMHFQGQTQQFPDSIENFIK